jgi:hypothetical protein
MYVVVNWHKRENERICERKRKNLFSLLVMSVYINLLYRGGELQDLWVNLIIILTIISNNNNVLGLIINKHYLLTPHLMFINVTPNTFLNVSNISLLSAFVNMCIT